MSKVINKNSLRIAIVSLLMLFVASVCLSIRTEAASVKLNYNSFTVAVDEIRTLQLKNADGNIKWTSSDEKIATVEDGKVTGVKEGKATITASYKSKKYKCEVTVKKYRLDSKKSTVTVGKAMQLTLKGNTEGKKIEWSTSNKKVLNVTSSGKVKALAAGEATITAKIGGKKYTKIITAAYKKPMFEADNMTITMGENKIVYVTHTGAENASASCSVENTDIVKAEWDNGGWIDGKIKLYLTGKNNGTTYITLTNDYNNEEIIIKVTVKGIKPNCSNGHKFNSKGFCKNCKHEITAEDMQGLVTFQFNTSQRFTGSTDVYVVNYSDYDIKVDTWSILDGQYVYYWAEDVYVSVPSKRKKTMILRTDLYFNYAPKTLYLTADDTGRISFRACGHIFVADYDYKGNTTIFKCYKDE